MRRTDREVTDVNEALNIVKQSKILHLGLFDEGYPYIVPLHYGYEYVAGTLFFFMHGAKEGHKLDLIRKNPNVCIQLECSVDLVSGGENACKYGATYASFIGRGRIELVQDETVKIRGLNLLMENQTGHAFPITAEMASSVEVLKAVITDFTAKERPKKNRNNEKSAYKEICIMVTKILEKMIAYSDGNIHDIDHLVRVWAYARMIGEQEALDSDIQFVLEVAAITHDIACPLCREKYGNTNGKRQEEEGAKLVYGFLKDTGMSPDQIDRVSFLVGHHHTLTDIDRVDWQILVEADYIANAMENGYSKKSIQSFMDKIGKTNSGRKLMQEVFCI